MKFITLSLILLFLSVLNLFSQEKNIKVEKDILMIINEFDDEDPYLNGEAVNEIVKYGNDAVDFLIESLQSQNSNVRWCSAIALGKIAPEGEKAIPYLTQALSDSDSNVRWCSVIALGNFGQSAEGAIAQLVNLLNDKDENVRWAMFIAIKKIDPEYNFQPPKLSDVISIIDNDLPSLMKDYIVPGVSIVLIEDREIVFNKSFGVKDVRTSEPVNENTMFEACSMTKPVFAFIVFQLVEQNKLDLDEPLSNYLDEKIFGEDSIYKEITARMILSHTSGLPNWRKGEEERNGPLPVYSAPGERFSYSGEGYFYLQRVIEKITGKSLEQIAKENLFIPLELNHSSFLWTEEFDSQISCGHDTSGNFLAKSKYVHPNSAYSLYITAEDYAKFIIEILNSGQSQSALLTENFKSIMLEPQVDVLVRDPIERPGRALGFFTYWSLGWAIDSTAYGNIYYHSGANRTGFRCYSQFNLEEGNGIVIMTNSLNGSELWMRLIKRIGDF
ncbi:MAG: serine hydrolase [Ignavibacteriaceae bacterium]|nr:serine hydrolase [Ignavibacteriaceae bacterium]